MIINEYLFLSPLSLLNLKPPTFPPSPSLFQPSNPFFSLLFQPPKSAIHAPKIRSQVVEPNGIKQHLMQLQVAGRRGVRLLEEAGASSPRACRPWAWMGLGLGVLGQGLVFWARFRRFWAWFRVLGLLSSFSKKFRILLHSEFATFSSSGFCCGP